MENREIQSLEEGPMDRRIPPNDPRELEEGEKPVRKVFKATPGLGGSKWMSVEYVRRNSDRRGWRDYKIAGSERGATPQEIEEELKKTASLKGEEDTELPKAA